MKEPHPTHRVCLPGFVKDDDVGLGDVVEHAPQSLGTRPCAGCAERARRMNRWLAFSRWHGDKESS
ncbi:hypothetical protein [Streptomyces sp. NPDC005828]|uniref:hypothetical protein n=1 Tax=Streptomyces sp. NPDC005828 TaxID=3157071 RepID=UPI0034038DDF